MPISIRYLSLVACICLATLSPPDPLMAADDHDERGLSRQQQSEFNETGDKFAVVVGINDYSRYSGVSPLNYAVADATALADVLEANGYVVQLIVDADANKRFIQRAINNVAKAMDKRDNTDSTLLFSFSGHGFAADGNNYLVTRDAVREEIVETGLALGEVQALLTETGVSRRVMFIDACRNDPNAGSKSIEGNSFVEHSGEGVGIIFSTKAGDFSYESDRLSQGVFSYYLVEALSGKAAQNGKITLQGVKRFLEDRVRKWSLQHIGEVQTPYLSGEYTGEFVLAHTSNNETTPPASTPVKPPRVVQPASQAPAKPLSIQQPAAPPPARITGVLIKPDRETVFLKDELSDFLTDHQLDVAANPKNALTIFTTNKGVYRDEEFGEIVIGGEVSVKIQHPDGKTLHREVIRIEGRSLSSPREAATRAARNFVSRFESSSSMGVLESAQ